MMVSSLFNPSLGYSLHESCIRSRNGIWRYYLLLFRKSDAIQRRELVTERTFRVKSIFPSLCMLHYETRIRPNQNLRIDSNRSGRIQSRFASQRGVDRCTSRYSLQEDFFSFSLRKSGLFFFQISRGFYIFFLLLNLYLKYRIYRIWVRKD